ncbi:hypothetical protein TrCOL_g9736 [Triparma columacea]|uniref:Phosphodiesterase n=1 Tax=Triparma columacea TaxID=722753 RepID=A0A9W7FX04_9STRA|nr:hypothetical protein TrCOL_g9736 [Triparma columacea]
MNFKEVKKCYNWNHEDPPLCISDLSVPIFGEQDDEEPDLESLTGCGKVQGSHAHNLWGAEWDFKEIFFDPELTDRPAKAEWNPVGFLDQIPTSDPPDLEERVDWWNSTESSPFLQQCPKDQAKEICEKKAIGLCEIAFDKGFYKFELYQKISNTTSVILAVVVMLFSITYAVYSEMTHRDRVRTRLKKQMEDSLSFKQNSAKIAPEGSDMAARDSRSQEKDEKFFQMLTTESGAKQVGTIRWWDINFMEQEMEDNYRKMLNLEKLKEIRYMIVVGIIVVFGYQYSIINSRVTINWTLRILLLVYCSLVIPLTYKSYYTKSEVFAELMFSNFMIVGVFIFLLIAWMDRFVGTPTDSFLLMSLVFFFQIIIMYITGIVWFRKFIINFAVSMFYIFISFSSIHDCTGYDEFLDGESDSGVQIAPFNAYPLLQLIPDFDTFKYNMSCAQKSENFNFAKQTMFVVLLWVMTSYTGYWQELGHRQDFGKRWGLLKNKIETDRKLKSLMDKENNKTRQRESLFGEIRDLTFKSPMMKIVSTLDRVKLAVGNDAQLLEALNTIETTLRENEDLNKVDIQKQDLNEKDKEFAQFVLSTGGKVGSNRDRVRSVPNLLSGDFDKGGVGLLTVVGLPEGVETKSFGPIVDYLANFEEWSFDILFFNQLTNKHPMYFIFMKHMERFYENYNFDLECMKAFAIHVEENYSFDPAAPNPYHTNVHGADVLQTVGVIIQTQFVNSKISGLDKITLLVASMCHDYRHKGVNNAFLVNGGDLLALLHNDSSVLERFHASEMFLLLKGAKSEEHENMNFLEGLSSEDFKQFRSVSIDLILATDLSHGYNYINKFNAYEKKGMSEWGNKPEDILILMQMVLKVADVSHPTKALDQHKCWSVMITNEFFQQGDLEKKSSMAVSPLCDRIKNFDIPKSQTGFIDFVVSPTIKNASQMLGLTEALKNLKDNYKYWSELHKSHTAKGTVDQSFEQLKHQVRIIGQDWDSMIKGEEGEA